MQCAVKCDMIWPCRTSSADHKSCGLANTSTSKGPKAKNCRRRGEKNRRCTSRRMPKWHDTFQPDFTRGCGEQKNPLWKNKKVRAERVSCFTALGNIHAFWVPSFAGRPALMPTATGMPLRLLPHKANLHIPRAADYRFEALRYELHLLEVHFRVWVRLKLHSLDQSLLELGRHDTRGIHLIVSVA